MSHGAVGKPNCSVYACYQREVGITATKPCIMGLGKEKKMGAHERKTCIGLGWGGKTHAFKLCQATVREEGFGKAAAAGETDITGTA